MNIATATIRVPGLRPLPRGMERYRVPGGGSIVVQLAAGDELRIVDSEGAQSGELVVFADGRPDPGVIGARSTGRPSGLLALLAAAGEEGGAVAAALARRNLDLKDAGAVHLFGRDSPAGAAVQFVAGRDAICVIAAPGEAMAIDAQDTLTDLLVFIQRAAMPEEGRVMLPDALADPRLDMRVDRCTARAYEVKAGEYIQIIDVQGRQCSDFLAFDGRRLQGGVERGLDATTTRTLMGAAYPAPGLHSKFFDQDMQPLVEVVRDTCGRHDTFGLACTAKYYEDMGYFGHVSCSENFNGALKPYTIAARRGWPAINLFYNTRIDANNVYYLDEPWSRPGDYVLLRAMTDLVCASSACPDDIDPANAWNPTDIHVRVYPARNTFSRAIAFRMKADAEPKLTRETAFHPRTSQLTRNFIEYRGYWLPSCYTGHGAIEEYYACRERAAVMDLSPLRKFEVLGPDAEQLMNYAVTRNIRKLAVGQVVYTAMCYPTGGMLDDGTVFRLGANNFRWIGGEEYGGEWLREQAARLNLNVWVRSSTDQVANIAVQGPASRAILKSFVWTPPAQPNMDELGWFRFSIGRLNDFNGAPIMISRTGYTGELGYEIWCHPKDAPAVWDAVWEAGRPHGMLPLGLSALDMLRIEAGLIFAGYEFCDQTDPFEAGIAFAVPLKTKEDDFIGRLALLRRSASPQRTLVGLELAGNEGAVHGDCVHVGRSQVGTVTSATRSPILRKNIALCRIDVNYAAPGTEVEVGKIDGHQKRIPAQVVSFPFYDPDKTRVRA
jgi:aminomethyltransferase